MDELFTKIRSIKETYSTTIQTFSKNNHAKEYTKLLTSTLNATFLLLEEKINDLHIPFSTREKRGLINGLGSVIKFISGNLDSQDEEKYNSILEHLQRNQQDLQAQIKAQYSINEAVQRNFNKTLETINFNNKELKKELEFWTYQKYPMTADSQSILEHHLILLNLLLNTVQDIENSLVACRTGVLHPSVISPHLLVQELRKLSKYYGNRFLNFENQNLLEIQSYIKVRCYVGREEIVYFLDIPIVDPETYTTYHLEPLPTLVNQEYLIIVPSVKYFLKSKNLIIPLLQKCPQGHLQLCPNYFTSPSKPECETQFLQTGDTLKCKFTKLITPTNHAKLMLEINQYLLFLPKSDSLIITTESNTEIKTLVGTYLISPGNSLIIYQNSTLFAPHNEFAGKPLIIGDFQIQVNPQQMPDKEIILKELELETLNIQDIRAIPKFDYKLLTIPSGWTMFMYVVLILLFVYTYLKYRKSIRPNI